MKEQEYINAKTLGKVTAAYDALSSIAPGNVMDTMDEGVFKDLMLKLSSWKFKLRKSIEIKE